MERFIELLQLIEHLPTRQHIFFTATNVCPKCDNTLYFDEVRCRKCDMDVFSLHMFLWHRYGRRLCQQTMDAQESPTSLEFVQRQLEHSPRGGEITCWLHGAGVYLIYGGLGRFKIGQAVDVQKRVRDLQTGTDDPLIVLHIIRTNNLDWCEGRLHGKFAKYRGRGEWFRLPFDVVGQLCRTNRLDETKSIITQQKMLDFLEGLSAT